VSILRQLATKSRPSTVELFTNTTTPWFGSRSRTGISVDTERGMRHAAVWACIRLRAETIGMLPVDVVSYDGPNRIVADDPVWLQKPNPDMTRFQLFELTSVSLDTDGNAFWWIDRDRLGRVTEVWPLPPREVSIYRDEKTAEKYFTIKGDRYSANTILHIPGFTLPGRLRGLSPIEQHMHALGLAIAAEQYGEAFFGNGAVMSGLIKFKADPGSEVVRRIQDGFAADHQGLENAHRPGALFGDADWVQLSIPNDAAQFLETRKYQTGEIARIWRVPPHKIGDLERATFSNIEHQGIEWVTDGVMPYTTRMEAAIRHAGLLERDQQLRFKFNGLVRGDIKSRYEAYAIGRQWGWLSADKIMELEDENPLPNGQGEHYLEPLNMRRADQVLDGSALSPRELAEMLQKVYLSVGVVITDEEARALMNRAGMDLTAPGLAPAPATEDA
jgi:HK97 family phage portal protein